MNGLGGDPQAGSGLKLPLPSQEMPWGPYTASAWQGLGSRALYHPQSARIGLWGPTVPPLSSDMPGLDSVLPCGAIGGGKFIFGVMKRTSHIWPI